MNSKQLFEFKEAFPGAEIGTGLEKIYKISLGANESTADILARNDVAYMEELSNEFVLAGTFPNDYDEIIFENLPNTVLDQIKAPLAWTITQGDPNILVGVADSPIDFTHEDLQGQFAGHIIIEDIPFPHGTAVASLIAAKTDNGIGMASIGYNTKMFAASCNGYSLSSLMEGVWMLSQQPGVKVINCSFAASGYSPIDAHAIENIASRGILVVAAAGNLGVETYKYPGAYNESLYVTSVGARYAIDEHHSLGIENRSWKDCHAFKPENPFFKTNNHNDKIDVTSPALLILSATDNYTLYPSGYTHQSNTSSATPIVSGLAALIYSVNPNFTAQEVKDIIRDTADDIYHIPYNDHFAGKLGTGRINAFRAVKTADCIVNPDNQLDLAMQNSRYDFFTEPDNDTPMVWESNDIWVRNQNDGRLIEVHENPVYDPSNPNYVYVNVTNNSCAPTTGNDIVKLYWSKANTALSWPDHWDGSMYVTDPAGQSVLMGDEVGQIIVPPLSPGEDVALEFQWYMPNPEDYMGINPNPWHFCLLARIESAADPMTFTETSEITQNVKNNNNIAWKNLTIINLHPDVPSIPGAAVAVGNPSNTAKSYNLEFQIEDAETGSRIYDEAEVTVEMDDIVYDAWSSGGKSLQHFKDAKTENKKIVLANNAQLNSIQFAPNESGTIYLSFNFLIDEATVKQKFTYRVVQRDAVTDSIIGGETYIVNRIPRSPFAADAGSDEEIDKNESITITAAQINEAAVYNWYDPEGNLVHTGTDLTVSPNVTQTYRLEVISDTDGYKDYDDVEVVVNPYKLESLVPNPAANNVTANYIADDAGSAYLMVVSTIDGTSNNYIVDTTLNTITLDIATYQTGTYAVALVCDGVIVDSKNLIKQ